MHPRAATTRICCLCCFWVYSGKSQLILRLKRFLKQHSRTNQFDATCKNVWPYKDFKQPCRGFWEVQFWQRNEMRSFITIVVSCLRGALDKPRHKEQAEFEQVITHH